ncbi:uncharacterized protein LOC117341433 [Pecten maximus]|uniref:uncharacterized protein LOC117316207 n=2 Tax=Pecten maximus TaxID=6579 RepID=UPI00145817F7|nr:uncharacterized protein LOC117316207 [Pecten maximus]XP_033726626.1 uncharacterized protein LOC117316207 [Pecten maximus]XP_033759173.1 uncharacterized protein LOC117341433 [Pecten maximus]
MTSQVVSTGRECCVASCFNKEYQVDGTKSQIHFFHIPKVVLQTRKLKDEWCNLIKRRDGKDNFHMTESTVICSEHFNKERDIKISIGTKRWNLLPGVRPTVFSWTKQVTRRKPPINRIPFKVIDENESTGYGDTTHHPSGGTLSEHHEEESGVGIQTEPMLTVDTGTQTEWLDSGDHRYSADMCGGVSTNIQALDDEVNILKEKLEESNLVIEQLSIQLSEFEINQFSYEKIKEDSKAMQFYTGFQNKGIFESVFLYLEKKAEKLQYWRGQSEVSETKLYQSKGSKPGQKRKLSLKEEFFIVLLRLKVGLFVRDISERFNISQGQFSKVFTTWVNFLYHELPIMFPFPSRELIRENLPDSFKPYPSTRIILDCTEVFVEVPSAMLAQSETWSNYKHHNTYKVLVGVSPNGVVTFVSELWGGRVSDKMITKESGVLDLLESGDNVMADRGFEIADILPAGVALNIPPFKGNRKQLSAKEVDDTMNIAAVRIHVERAIGRIKNYHILDGVLPLSLKHISSQMFLVVAYLTNFLPPLVPPGKS